MKYLSKVMLLLAWISSSPVIASEEITIDDLVERDGLRYEKFTDIPYNGEVVGVASGSFKQGVKTGLWRHYHENGQLESKGAYVEGKKNGEWVSYFSRGRKRTIGNYVLGEEDGLWTFYHEYGDAEPNTINYNKGRRSDGPFEWLSSNGDVIEKGTYLNGVLDGPYFKKPTRPLNFGRQGLYVAGKKEGLWRHEGDGYLYIVNFRGGLEDGLKKSYDSRGKLKSEITYSKGKRHGLAIFYEYSEVTKGFYQDGEKSGRWEIFRPINTRPNLKFGRLVEVQNYANSKKNGVWEKYNVNGEVTEKTTYSDGLIVSND